LYSGSADGRVHIWSLDGRIVQILDRSKTLPMTFDPSESEHEPTKFRRSNPCVRDVSWHSHEPVLMSAAWESHNAGSIVARHEWKGLSKMRGNLEDWNEKQRQEEQETTHLRRSERLRTRIQHVPGAYANAEEEEEEVF